MNGRSVITTTSLRFTGLFPRSTTRSLKIWSPLPKVTKEKFQKLRSIPKEQNFSPHLPIKLREFGTLVLVNACRCVDDYEVINSELRADSDKIDDIFRRFILKVLEGHKDEIFSCAFNYEGSAIITGSKDNSCRIWT